ncbi:MAG: hypothetical protein RR444_10100 [Oscillospiraceae bacterium]
MTAKIENGDYVFKNNGSLIEISGKDAILQRALFRLKAHRGKFELDKTIGSELYKLDLKSASNDRLFVHITEALMPIEELEVTGVEKAVNDKLNQVYITVYLKLNNEDAIIELVNP